MKALNIGLLGCGNVGQGFVELVRRSRSLVESRAGVSPRISRILVRDAAKVRSVDGAEVVTDSDAFFHQNHVVVVVELIGGVEPARTLVLRALESGRHVVTANKALLAAHGGEIFSAAAANRAGVGFEASVCGAIPIIRALQNGLIANRIEFLAGIVNGTNNFILTAMSEKGLTLAEALKEAQARGLTEADPTLDLAGIDAQQKLVILASLAFGRAPDPASVHVTGIAEIDREDIRSAAEFGFVVRHIAVADARGGALDLRVEPAFLPKSHPLAAVRDEFNAVLVRGDAAGEMIFHGKGAGPFPTASAVLSDVIDVATRPGGVPRFDGGPLPASSVEATAPFYLRFPILDVPGAIGLIATALGNHDISISRLAAVLDPARPGNGSVKVQVHDAPVNRLRKVVAEVARLPIMAGKPVVVRIV